MNKWFLSIVLLVLTLSSLHAEEKPGAPVDVVSFGKECATKTEDPVLKVYFLGSAHYFEMSKSLFLPTDECLKMLEKKAADMGEMKAEGLTEGVESSFKEYQAAMKKLGTFKEVPLTKEKAFASADDEKKLNAALDEVIAAFEEFGTKVADYIGANTEKLKPEEGKMLQDFAKYADEYAKQFQ